MKKAAETANAVKNIYPGEIPPELLQVQGGFDLGSCDNMVDNIVELTLRSVIEQYKELCSSYEKVVEWDKELAKIKISIDILLTQQKEMEQKVSLEKLKIEGYQKAVKLSDNI